MLEPVSPFIVGPALEAMRSEGHDFTSALGEVIDNSFGHGDASEVRIKLDWYDSKDRRRQILREVHVADNGMGMDPTRLRDCLVLGFSTTYNRRDSIGRFGFGMTVGAIGQCRRVEVYSRTKDTYFNYVVLDLDIFKDGKEKIDPPILKKIPKEYEDFLGEHGTLVIWKNIDKVTSFNSQKDVDDLKYNLGRIYRKFIASEIIENNKAIPNPRKRKILIDGQQVVQHDPLYHTKKPGFENDPRSELYDEIRFAWPLYPTDYQGVGTKEGTVIIRISILPEEFREVEGEGGKPEAQKRHIPENEAISILRMDREVYYGPIRGIGPLSYDTKDRWWGMEICFNPELDGWFTVKTVKKGAVPIDELKKEIDKRVNSTIKNIREIVTDHWKEKKSQEQKDVSHAGTGGHERAEEKFEEAGIGKSRFSDEIPKEEKEKTAEELIKRFAKTDEEIEEIRKRWDHLNIKWFNDFELTENDLLIDINPKGGTTALTYNQKHPFFTRIDNLYHRLEEIENITDIKQLSHTKRNIVEIIDDIKFSIDALLGSYAAASVGFKPELKQEIGTTLTLLLSSWGSLLKVTTLD